MKRIIFVAGVVIFGFGASVRAQCPYGQFFWSEPHHSATLTESIGRGWGAAQMGNAQVILAEGLRAEANERASQQHYYNQVTQVRALDELKQLHDAADAQRKAKFPRLSANDSIDVARQNQPKRLTVAELDSNGRIQWPSLLAADSYAQSRKALNQLFHQKAAGVPTDRQNTLRNSIREQIEQLQQLLADNFRNTLLSLVDYVAANNFVRSLNYEAQFENRLAVVAAEPE